MKALIKRSFLNAFATTAYVLVVVTIMQNAERIFGPKDNMLGPVAFLMLFVLSAAITGSLVLGKPALMYLNGHKSDAIKLFMYTVGWLALGTVILIGASAAI